jgi:hypothetical protein
MRTRLIALVVIVAADISLPVQRAQVPAPNALVEYVVSFAAG